jgi:hypothetical protein
MIDSADDSLQPLLYLNQESIHFWLLNVRILQVRHMGNSGEIFRRVENEWRFCFLTPKMLKHIGSKVITQVVITNHESDIVLIEKALSLIDGFGV